MEYLITLLYTIVFIFILNNMSFFRAEGLSKKTLSVIFVIKILAGITMSLVYTYYYTDRYTADIFKYFDDSKVMYDALFKKPLDYLSMMTSIGNDSSYFNEHYYKLMNNWYRVYESNIYNESHTIIRFNALIRIFSFGYYNVHTVFVCFLSLAGLVAIYKTVTSFIKNKNKEIIFGIFLLPSVLFWGSGVIKEGLLFFGLGILIYHFFRITKKFNFVSFAWVFASAVLIYYTKFYVLAIVIPILIAHFWITKTNEKYIFLKYLTVFILYIFAGLQIHHVFPGFDALDILVTKQRDFIGLAKFTKAGSLIDIPLLTPDIWSFIKYAPQAFFITLFRPFIFEADSLLILMAAMENILILVILILTLIFANFRQVNKSIFYICLFAVLCMFILTGLITPVTGAMVRYKVPALPFLMILLVMLIDREKMIKKIPFLKFLVTTQPPY
ncbi:MAG: hypothetical protein WC599_02015 [Bacteroidales bacterium]